MIKVLAYELFKNDFLIFLYFILFYFIETVVAGQYGKIFPSRLSNTEELNFNNIMFSNWECFVSTHYQIQHILTSISRDIKFVKNTDDDYWNWYFQSIDPLGRCFL